MKTSTAQLDLYLATSRLILSADLIAITLPNGTVARYTNRDLSLYAEGQTWTGGTPLWRRTGTRRVIGIEVGTTTLTVTARDTDMIGGMTWADMIRSGLLDGCEVVIRRAYFTDWLQPAVGSLHVFEGRIGEVSGGSGEWEIPVRSAMDLLSTPIPRSVYQAPCRNLLFDAATCKLAKASFEVAATVTASGVVTLATNLVKPADWATGGALLMTSGLNNGATRGIKSQTAAGGIVLIQPFATAPAVGDTCLISAGCDSQVSTCKTKFANIINFRGESYVPTPETAL